MECNLLSQLLLLLLHLLDIGGLYQYYLFTVDAMENCSLRPGIRCVVESFIRVYESKLCNDYFVVRVDSIMFFEARIYRWCCWPCWCQRRDLVIRLFHFMQRLPYWISSFAARSTCYEETDCQVTIEVGRVLSNFITIIHRVRPQGCFYYLCFSFYQNEYDVCNSYGSNYVRYVLTEYDSLDEVISKRVIVLRVLLTVRVLHVLRFDIHLIKARS